MFYKDNSIHLQGEFQIGWKSLQVFVFAFFAFSCGYSIRVSGIDSKIHE
jgi:hypothetical protein